jgi:putative nucleotidyltransferase with HDIG domain
MEAGRDEGFAALLLKVANSAHSASAYPISDLAAAVSRIGLNLAQALALAAPGVRLLAGPRDGLAGERRALHRHAVRTGLVARQLAPRSVDAEAALAAGLLHNIGLSVLSLHEPDTFRLLIGMTQRGLQLGPVEQELLGFTHAYLGARVADGWSYPDELVRAIAEHDAETPATQLAALTQVADLVVRSSGVGVEAPGELRPEIVATAGVDPDSMMERVTPLLEAQTRFDLRESAEGAGREPESRSQTFAEALEALV